jgi:hypothetical protein
MRVWFCRRRRSAESLFQACVALHDLVVVDCDGDRFLRPDEIDLFFSAGHAGIEQVAMQ